MRTKLKLWSSKEAAEKVGCSVDVFMASVARCISAYLINGEPFFAQRDVIGRVEACRYFGHDPFRVFE